MKTTKKSDWRQPKSNAWSRSIEVVVCRCLLRWFRKVDEIDLDSSGIVRLFCKSKEMRVAEGGSAQGIDSHKVGHAFNKLKGFCNPISRPWLKWYINDHMLVPVNGRNVVRFLNKAFVPCEDGNVACRTMWRLFRRWCRCNNRRLEWNSYPSFEKTVREFYGDAGYQIVEEGHIGVVICGLSTVIYRTAKKQAEPVDCVDATPVSSNEVVSKMTIAEAIRRAYLLTDDPQTATQDEVTALARKVFAENGGDAVRVNRITNSRVSRVRHGLREAGLEPLTKEKIAEYQKNHAIPEFFSNDRHRKNILEVMYHMAARDLNGGEGSDRYLRAVSVYNDLKDFVKECGGKELAKMQLQTLGEKLEV